MALSEMLARDLLDYARMAALRILMLLVVVTLIYLMFLKSQSPNAAMSREDAALTAPLVSPTPGAQTARATTGPHSQYKEAMDRAHAAAKQMQDERIEANSQ